MKRNRITALLFFISFLFPATFACAQQPKVSARIDSSHILIGQQFRLLLEGQADASRGGFSWATVPDTFNHLMVVDRGKIDTLTNGAQQTYRQAIVLTGFDSGRWQVPALSFGWKAAGGSTPPDTLHTSPLQVMVNTVPVDTTQPFRPIKDVRRVPVNLIDFWYIPAILLALLIAFFVWRRYRGRKKPLQERPAAPPPPPYETALKALHELEAEKLWQAGEVKTYYIRLTDILRIYMERQFRIPAMELTTDEVLQQIKKVTQLSQRRETLQYILQTADLAKFAKLQPMQEEHERCMKSAYQLLEWTKPKEEEEK
ncbi:hypothetical protein [Compostibacter hankyongensis]|uniref:Protein BatD n=1 Tax=Compostibacter hankyongensis TaxID=1007089 RepID=A0ABP8FE65_9BACT